MMKNENVSVQCYSGITYAQEPRAFVHDQQRYAVRAVRKRWREPGGICFEIVADNAQVYRLVYHEAADRWTASVLRVNNGPSDITIPEGIHMLKGDQR